jgi:hypothetical protein
MAVEEFFVFGDGIKSVIHSKVTGNTNQPQGEVIGINKGDMNKFGNLRLFAQAMSLNNRSK